MHSYLPAIGFGQIKKKSQFQKLLESIVASPDSMTIVPIDEESNCTVLTREVEDGIGLALCGETDSTGQFQMEYHFPYILSRIESTGEECTIRKQSDRDAYNGMCDDYRLGLNLIFFLNNFMDYKKREQLTHNWPQTNGACLSALAVSGKILLPVQKTAKQQRILQKDSSQCRQLLEAARQGDQSAMEDLAVRDMQLYSQVSQRVAKQDLYSVVETFFMPCGAECDQYTIMGYITAFRKTVNRVSGEGLYILELECNEIPLRVCIGESGLLGEPKVGRRFKGDIWLQGKGII